MTRGRKPKPPQLKVLAGTARKDRESPPDMPEFDLLENFPPPPKHLGPDGIEMWNDAGPQLVKAKVLQTVDLYALEQLCGYWEMVRKKMKAGMETTAAEQQALKSLLSEFAMTPASRRKVSAGDGKKTGNKFAENGKRRA